MLRLLSICVLVLTGCPERSGVPSSTEPAKCIKRGSQCELAPGALGVCNDAPCPAGREPPCLACTSQH
jgi:hypothetical protein